MPRLKNKVPSYRLHKATDQAVVALNDRYFFNGLSRDCAIRHWGNHILGWKRQRTGPLTHEVVISCKFRAARRSPYRLTQADLAHSGACTRSMSDRLRHAGWPVVGRTLQVGRK